MRFRVAADGGDYGNVLELYNSAFPVDERRLYRDVRDFRAFAESRIGKFYILVAETDDSNFMGFISFWKFEKFVYVEHFAVVEDFRGIGVGTALLEALSQLAGDELLLEVELPVDDLTCRRVRFYEKSGFRLFDGFRYIQPPYSPAQNGMELKLMIKGDFVPSSVSDLSEMLREVYNASVCS